MLSHGTEYKHFQKWNVKKTAFWTNFRLSDYKARQRNEREKKKKVQEKSEIEKQNYSSNEISVCLFFMIKSRIRKEQRHTWNSYVDMFMSYSFAVFFLLSYSISPFESYASAYCVTLQYILYNIHAPLECVKWIHFIRFAFSNRIL